MWSLHYWETENQIRLHHPYSVKYRTLTPNLISQPVPLFPAWWSYNSGTLLSDSGSPFCESQNAMCSAPLVYLQSFVFHVILPLQVEIHIQVNGRSHLCRDHPCLRQTSVVIYRNSSHGPNPNSPQKGAGLFGRKPFTSHKFSTNILGCLCNDNGISQKKKIKWHIIVTHSGQKNSPLKNLSYVIWPTISGALLPCHCCAIQVPVAGRRGRAPRCGRLGGSLGVQHGGALGSGGAQVRAPGASSLVECWLSQLHSSSIQRCANVICRTPKPLRISILFNPPPQLIPPSAPSLGRHICFFLQLPMSCQSQLLDLSPFQLGSLGFLSCFLVLHTNPSKGHGMSWVGNIVDPPNWMVFQAGRLGVDWVDAP